MTPKEQWFLQSISNAPIQTVEQARWKAEYLLELTTPQEAIKPKKAALKEAGK